MKSFDKLFPPSRFWVFPLVFACFLLFPAFAEAQAPEWSMLWGTDTGLYGRNRAGNAELLWPDGKVLEIIPLSRFPGRETAARNKASAPVSGWAMLTDKGIMVSENLEDWEERNRGLPEKLIKIFENGEKSFITTVEGIKALSVNAENPEIMVCAVKDAVYLSRSGGESWESLGMPNYRTNGIKAVAAVFLPGAGEGARRQNPPLMPEEAGYGGGELTVFCSHGVYGVYYFTPGKSGAKWTELNAGFEKLETTDNPDEISDFAAVHGTVYASQSFRRRVYRLDRERESWELVWSDASEAGAADSLFAGDNSLCFVRDGGIVELSPLDSAADGSALPGKLRRDLEAAIKTVPKNYRLNCAALLGNGGGPRSAPARTPAQRPSIQQRQREQTVEISAPVSFSELWLLDESSPAPGGMAVPAANREGLYLPVNHAMDSTSLKPYLDLIQDRKLNMVVIDMKDDYGRLRFTPQNPSLTKLGRVFWPVDIDEFLKTMKARGIYTVARIVVFKDPEAARKNGEQYAVWDGVNDKAWEGYYDTRRKKPLPGGEYETNPALKTSLLPDSDPEYEILRTWYDEKWVDPYSEVIWDYNASVAEELHRRGFDEIQFDYIRFPTDGVNLDDAQFRWREAGMDMDSAILSFLRHTRARVKAPISVDIYGANGWYRTGARTGQEVELLAPWVDIICPMYYPSHFEQGFLAQAPSEERPYRIYFQGTRRTRFIARGRVIVRPWAQAFYLNVSYDRKYYNPDYVRRQLEGVRAAGTGGVTYWNNSGRYADIP